MNEEKLAKIIAGSVAIIVSITVLMMIVYIFQ